MIESLFPPGVNVAAAEIDPTGVAHPDEAGLARSMSPARRAEFTSARACARRALEALGHGDAPIPRGERRMPVWPEGVVGSITHSGGWCAAAVGRAEHWLGIGLDAEPRRPLSKRALERIASASERRSLAALPDAPPEIWGTLVFSAKESLYKALFPHTRRFLAFREAEIELAPDSSGAGRFTATLLQAESIARIGAERFEGRFASGGAAGRWLTGLAIPTPRSSARR